MQLSQAGAPPARNALHVVVTSVASDSHTWNLIYLQLLLEELGHQVTNLGACVPDDLMVDECRRLRPDLVVISSVNGHGHHDGLRVIGRLRDCPELRETPVVIGGKLGITGGGDHGPLEELRAAGFDAVFEDGTGIARFQGFVRALPPRVMARVTA
ncbi:cobalamin B12-binding domain-containing protein [Streptomyces sp. NPDC051921]|uniref:cobalamin B12-binding domain-containing protein n=1 Tax=Streptomyces sp. NPDC051921 TaxID=3155806 RepID=UPI00344904B9